jgi:threonine synthase
VRTLLRFDGVVEQASEAELADAAARADLTGMFNDPHTGVALAVLEKLVAAGSIRAGQKVVVVSTANGLKFTDFKVGYHDSSLGELGITSRYANRAVALPADFDVVRRRVFAAD